MASVKTKEQKDEIKNYLSKLYYQGTSFRGMSRWISDNTDYTADHKTCKRYIDEILEEWHVERIADVDKWITAELKGLNEVEREAWEAWEKSKKDRTKSVTRKRGAKAKRGNDIITTGIEQYDEVISGAGDPRFLEIIKDCKLQRLMYLTKGTFNHPEGGNVTNNLFMQQVIEIGVVDRQAPEITDSLVVGVVDVD